MASPYVVAEASTSLNSAASNITLSSLPTINVGDLVVFSVHTGDFSANIAGTVYSSNARVIIDGTTNKTVNRGGFGYSSGVYLLGWLIADSALAAASTLGFNFYDTTSPNPSKNVFATMRVMVVEGHDSTTPVVTSDFNSGISPNVDLDASPASAQAYMVIYTAQGDDSDGDLAPLTAPYNHSASGSFETLTDLTGGGGTPSNAWVTTNDAWGYVQNIVTWTLGTWTESSVNNNVDEFAAIAIQGSTSPTSIIGLLPYTPTLPLQTVTVEDRAPKRRDIEYAVSSSRSATSLTITAPTISHGLVQGGGVAGDLLIIGLYKFDDNTAPTAPGGYTAIDNTIFNPSGAGDDRFDLWYKIATNLDPLAANITIQANGSGSRLAGFWASIGGTEQSGDAVYDVVSFNSNFAGDPTVALAANNDYMDFNVMAFEGKNLSNVSSLGTEPEYSVQPSFWGAGIESSGGGSPRLHGGIRVATGEYSQIGSLVQRATFASSGDDQRTVAFLVRMPQSVNVTVNATTIACTSTVPTVTVTIPSGLTVTPGVIACTSTVPAPTITQGTGVTVSPAAIACTSTVPGSTIKVNETLLVATIACTSTVPAPTVTAAQNITVSPAVIACTSTTPAPTVTQGTGNSTSPATAACTSTVPAVTVSAGTGVSVSPGVIACTTSVPTSTVKVNETLLIAVIACTSTVPSPTITQGSGVTVSPTTVATAATVPAPTVTTGSGVTPSLATVAAAATTPAVTVTTGTGVTTAPNTVAGSAVLPVTSIKVNETLLVGTIGGTSTMPTSTVTAGTGLTTSPATIACTSSVPAPTITVESNVTVSPATIAAVSAVPAVTIIASGSIQVTPSTIATAAATPAVTVSLGTGVTVSPSTIAATSTVPAVTVSVGDGASPATIAAVAAVPTVTVTQGAGVTVSPATVATTSTVPVPAVLAGIIPATIETVTVVLGPTVTVGAGVTVGIDVISCSGTPGLSKVTKPLFVVPGQLPIPRRGGRLQFDVAAGHRQGEGKPIKI
jgi:hypothetical protein